MPWVVIGIYLFGAGCGDGGPQASSMGSLALYSYSLKSLLSKWFSDIKKSDPGTIIFLVSGFTFCWA